MNTDKQSFSGAAGEYLVLGELLRKNYEAYLASGKTQKDWDIVLLNESGENIRIQVKSIDWPNKTAINGHFESGFDFLVIVLHNREEFPRYLIIPQTNLEELISAVNPNRDDKGRTLTVGKKFETHKKKLSQYENNWKVFENLQT